MIRPVRTLIACISCDSRPEHRAAQRETWTRDISGDVRFFVGRGAVLGGADVADTVVLDADDSYDGLTQKTWRIAQYALDCGYEQVFKANDDVLVLPQHIRCPPLTQQFVGWRPERTWVHGHAFWLRPDALRVLARQPEPAVLHRDLQVEDRWVSALLPDELADDGGIGQPWSALSRADCDLGVMATAIERGHFYAAAEFVPVAQRWLYAQLGERNVPTIAGTGPVRVVRTAATRIPGYETVEVPGRGGFTFHDGAAWYSAANARVLVACGAARYADDQDLVEFVGV
jgi:hypothetical protein